MSDMSVGIRLDLNEQVSTSAPRVAEAFNKMGEAGAAAGEKISRAFDDAGLQDALNSFSKKVDDIYNRERARGGVPGPSGSAPEAPSAPSVVGRGGRRNPFNLPPGMERFVNTEVSAMRQAGSGDALGGGVSAVRGVGGLLGGLGAAGMVAGGAIAGVGLAGFAGNEIAKLYESVLPDAMNLAAALGDLAGTTEENSNAFRQALIEAGDSAAEFGYEIRQGTEVMRTFAGFVDRGAMQGEAQNVFAYGRGFGVDPNSIAQFVARGRQFGVGGNLPGMVAGGLEESGMGAGRFQEYMNATLSLFEEGLSQGVVRGFDEISRTQNYFAQGGELFRGSQGAQLLSQLNATVRGGTNLASDADVVRFAAFSGMNRGGSYIDTMRAMEAGITPESFRAIGEQIQTMTGGNEVDMIEMFREVFGTNYSMSTQLLDLFRSGDLAGAARVLEAPDAQSPELRLLSLQQEIANEVKLIGSSLIEAKANILDAADTVVRGISNALGVRDTTITGGSGNAIRATEEDRRSIASALLGSGMPDQANASAVGQISQAFNQASPEQQRMLLDAVQGMSNEQLQRIRTNRGVYQAVSAAGGRDGLTGADFGALIEEFMRLSSDNSFVTGMGETVSGARSSRFGNIVHSDAASAIDRLASRADDKTLRNLIDSLSDEQYSQMGGAFAEARNAAGMILNRNDLQTVIGVLTRAVEALESSTTEIVVEESGRGATR